MSDMSEVTMLDDAAPAERTIYTDSIAMAVEELENGDAKRQNVDQLREAIKSAAMLSTCLGALRQAGVELPDEAPSFRQLEAVVNAGSTAIEQANVAHVIEALEIALAGKQLGPPLTAREMVQVREIVERYARLKRKPKAITVPKAYTDAVASNNGSGEVGTIAAG